MAGPRQRSWTNHQRRFLLLLTGKAPVAWGNPPPCAGTVDIAGFGLAALVPSGWQAPEGAAPVKVHGTQVIPHMNGRAYFANGCSSGSYNPADYLALNLLGKTIRYTTDLSGSTCGCNAALYLTSMHHSTHAGECSDYYCDANSVCGQSCAEIDLQEANQFAWHSTLHTSTDSSGLGAGYGGGGKGWSGPRSWMADQYGPYSECIDTTMPFDVAVSFPADASCQLTSLKVVLSQAGRYCPVSLEIKGYSGMAELTEALRRGMAPTVSYWGSDDLGWMDGLGADQKGPCSFDAPKACAEVVRFHNFSIHEIENSPCVKKLTDQPPADVVQQGRLFSKVATAAGCFIVGAIVTYAVLIAVPFTRQLGGLQPPVGPHNTAISTMTSTKVQPISDRNGDLKRAQLSSGGLLAMCGVQV